MVPMAFPRDSEERVLGNGPITELRDVKLCSGKIPSTVVRKIWVGIQVYPLSSHFLLVPLSQSSTK